MDRQVYCLGKSEYGTLPSSHFGIRDDSVQLAACGDAHTVVLTASGRIFVFGKNEWGQLGLGHVTKITKPTVVSSLQDKKVTSIACGRYHTLALLEDGHIYACGGNSDGQLGIKGNTQDFVSNFEKVDLPPGGWVAIACGGAHSGALHENGSLYLWGANSCGQLGVGSTKQQIGPKQVKVKNVKKISKISCGYYHTVCVSDKGEVFSFGESDGGKLGIGDVKAEAISTPTKVSGVEGNILALACGSNHTVVVTDVAIFAWGDGSQGQLGLGESVESTSIPLRLDFIQQPDTAAIMVACGETHTAIITENNKLFTCGCAANGRLGHTGAPVIYQLREPAEITADWNIHSVSCGACHTIATVSEKPMSDVVSSLSSEEEDEDTNGHSINSGNRNTAQPLNNNNNTRQTAQPKPKPVVSRITVSEDSDSDSALPKPVLRPQSARQRRRQNRSLSPISRPALATSTSPTNRNTLHPLGVLRGGLPRLSEIPRGPSLNALNPSSSASLSLNPSLSLNSIHEDSVTPLALSDTDEDHDDDATNDVVHVSPAPDTSPPKPNTTKGAGASSTAAATSSSTKAPTQSEELSSTSTSLASALSEAKSSGVSSNTSSKGTASKRWWRRNGSNNTNASGSEVTDGAAAAGTATEAGTGNGSTPSTQSATSTTRPTPTPTPMPQFRNGGAQSKACVIL